MEKKKRDKDRKAVKDDFYDRINYYESRNIFSSNEPFNPGNRLYTDHAAISHPVWNTMGKNPNPALETIIASGALAKPSEVETPIVDKELTQSLMTSINKLNTSSTNTSIACKKCGYGKIFNSY